MIDIIIEGETLKFPSVWLRDNCQCEKCFHPSAKSRIIDWSNFDLNIKATNVECSEKSVRIKWSDGHISNYSKNWLRLRSFLPEHQKQYKETVYKPTKIPWHGENMSKICSRHDYNEILTSDDALYCWLTQLSKYGIAIIKNTPQKDNAIDRIVGRVGFPKQTHYGVKFIVQHVVNTSNVAYLSNNLPMHVDLPYYEYCPGVNLLHCLVQTSSQGGENLICDAHYVANYMKINHTEHYRLLTETEVEWSDIGCENGNDFFKLHRQPVICLGKDGKIKRINFSIPQRGNSFSGKIEDVKAWYEAHKLFLELNHKFSAKFKTEAGDILVFDNIRMLHGRNAYEDNGNNVRKLIGVYLDWDEIYSRLRCLKVKLENIDGI